MSPLKLKLIASRVALGAAFVCMAPALAQATTLSGKGVLTYASGFSGTGVKLALAGVGVNPLGSASESGGLLSPTSFSLPITGFKLNSAGTGLSSVSFGTSGLEFEKGFLFLSKDIDFTNLAFDFGSKSLTGKTGGGTMSLFTASSVSGSLNGTTGSFSYTASGLKLSSAAASKIGSALGVSSHTLAKINFGTLKITGAIPEPSTYALIGLGLAGAAVAARRRQKAQA